MSAPRYCPACDELEHGHFSPAPDNWRCAGCRHAQRSRGRAAVEAYARALNYDDPEDWLEHEQTAIDLVADILHYLTSLDSSLSLEPQRLTDPATRHYLAEHEAVEFDTP